MKAEELMIGDWVIVHRIECVGDGGQFQEWKQIGYITRINEDTVYVMFDKQKEDWEEIDVKDIHPISLTPEILEKNDFKKDAFTNLSPDYYFKIDEYTICVNLNSTCDKSKSIWIEKRSSRFTVSIEESRHSLDKKPLYVHQLQHALRLCGIEKTIEL